MKKKRLVGKQGRVFGGKAKCFGVNILLVQTVCLKEMDERSRVCGCGKAALRPSRDVGVPLSRVQVY